MTSLTAGRVTNANLGWAAAAIALGAGVGFLVVTEGLLGIGYLLAVLGLLGWAYAVVRSPIASLAVAVAALAFDVTGRIIQEPMPFTIYQVALLIALVSYGLAVMFRRTPMPKLTFVDIGMFMLVLAGAWSLPFSAAPSATIIGTIRLLFVWAFVLLIENVPQSRRDMRMLLGVLALVSAAHALLGVAQAAIPSLGIGNVHVQGPPTDLVRRPSGFFDDPNYYAGMLSAGFIAAGALTTYARRWRTAIFWAGVALVCGAGIVVTFSRTAWVAVAVGLVVLAITAPPYLRKWLISAGIACLIALFLYAPGQIIDRLTSSADVDGDRSVATRVYMAESMVEMIRENPVWGTGLAAFDRVYPYYRKTGADRTIARPHQVPMGVIAETGVAGLLALIVLVIALGWTYLAPGKRRLWMGESAALAGLASMSVQSLLQYYLYFEYLWLFVGLSVVAVRLGRTQEEL